MLKQFEEISSKWFYHAPFLSEFLYRFSFIETEKIETAGIGMINNSLTLYYNSKWINSLNKNEIEGVLIHEILHLLAFTQERKKGRDHYIWNVATDIVNNEEILTNCTIKGEQVKLPQQGCFLKDIQKDGYSGKTIADDVYDFVYKNAKKIYITFDDHSNMDSIKDEKLKLKIEQIKNAAIKRSYGSISESFQKYLSKLLKPQRISLKQIIRNNLQDIIYGFHNIDYTWTKENRKNIPILPGKYTYSNSLTIVVDTSGSCYDDKFFQCFFTEIDYFANIIDEIKLIQFDTEVKGMNKYKKGDWKKIKLMGGGGTDIQPVFDYLNKKKIKSPLLIFTDGEFNWNLKTYGYHPLWLLSNNDVKVSFGKSILLKNFV